MNPSQSVHIINVPTNIYPNYSYLATENAFLKQNIEYKDAVICEQQTTINGIQEQMSLMQHEANSEISKLQFDALRWQTMKKILLKQGGPQKAAEVQGIIDRDIRASQGKDNKKDE